LISTILYKPHILIRICKTEEVYFGKAKDVVGDLRSIPPLSEANRDRAAQREMISSMAR
jgi:hypothetical protein